MLIIVLSLFANFAHANGNEIRLIDTNAINLIESKNFNPGNNINLDVDGSGNLLEISQTLTIGALVGNNINVSIVGDSNGGGLTGSFYGNATKSELTAGTVTQIGYDNNIDFAVIGSGNLFAFLQNGSSNSIRGSVRGFHNQASVSQFGSNNRVGFSQSGTGNIMNIVQRSW